MWFNEILFLCDSSEDSKQDFMKKLIPIQSPSLPYNNSLAYGASFVYWDRRARIFLLFGYPMTNFGLLSRWQPHSPDIKHCVIQFRSTRRSPRAS